MDTRFRQVDVRSSTLCNFRPHPAEDVRQAWHGRLMSPLPSSSSHFHSLIPDVDNSSLSNKRVMSSRSASPTSFRKPCTLCSKPQPVLVRCQIDASGTWHLVCPGKCWTSVSGGTIDAAGHRDEFPYYRYGGMWKNKHEMVSAKKPKEKTKANRGTTTAVRSNSPKENEA